MAGLITTPARELIHMPSVGDAEMCTVHLKILNLSLQRELHENKIRGYQVITVHHEDDINSHFIETDYKKITNNRFPFLYLFIQPVTSYEELKRIAESLELVPCERGDGLKDL